MASQKTAVRAKQGMQVRSGDDGMVLRTGMTVLALAAFGIGVWAVVSLVGGGAASGGPLELASHWLKAVLN